MGVIVDMHKRLISGSTESTVEVELLRADMLSLLETADGAVLCTLNDDGSVSMRAFGDNSKLFSGALIGTQRLVLEHLKRGGDNADAG